MNAKLTLKMDACVIRRAKQYAHKKKTSLSALVEGYFKLLTVEQKETSLTEEIRGCLSEFKHLDDRAIKKEYYSNRTTE
jgi:hypothetical protein